MSPKTVVQRSEVKHIKVKKVQIEEHVTKLFDQPKGETNGMKELKV